MTAPDPTAGVRETEKISEYLSGVLRRASASPPAAAASTGTSEDVEALLLADCPCGHSIRAHDDDHICWGSECECERDRYEAILASDWLAAREAAARAEEREALVVLDGLLRRWETTPALRRATAAAEVRRALGEHLARAAREAR